MFGDAYRGFQGPHEPDAGGHAVAHGGYPSDGPDPASTATLRGAAGQSLTKSSTPSRAGRVYLLKDPGEGDYFCKARSLRIRVGTYFAAATTLAVRFLMQRVADFDSLVTQARGTLIPEQPDQADKPRYNIRLKRQSSSRSR